MLWNPASNIVVVVVVRRQTTTITRPWLSKRWHELDARLVSRCHCCRQHETNCTVCFDSQLNEIRDAHVDTRSRWNVADLLSEDVTLLLFEQRRTFATSNCCIVRLLIQNASSRTESHSFKQKNLTSFLLLSNLADQQFIGQFNFESTN